MIAEHLDNPQQVKDPQHVEERPFKGRETNPIIDLGFSPQQKPTATDGLASIRLTTAL